MTDVKPGYTEKTIWIYFGSEIDNSCIHCLKFGFTNQYNCTFKLEIS